MDLEQVGKAVFVKENFTSKSFELWTFSFAIYQQTSPQLQFDSIFTSFTTILFHLFKLLTIVHVTGLQSLFYTLQQAYQVTIIKLTVKAYHVIITNAQLRLRQQAYQELSPNIL